MRTKFSMQAKADLRRIVLRIARDNPHATKGVYRKLRDRIRLAGRSPRLGRKVPELDRDDIREAIVGAYRIVYVIEAKAVVIQTIFEGHHLLPDLES